MPREWWHECHHEVTFLSEDVCIEEDDSCSICEYTNSEEGLTVVELQVESQCMFNLQLESSAMDGCAGKCEPFDSRGPPGLT